MKFTMLFVEVSNGWKGTLTQETENGRVSEEFVGHHPYDLYETLNGRRLQLLHAYNAQNEVDSGETDA